MNIFTSSVISKESNGFLLSLNLFNIVTNNDNKFWNVINSLSSNLDKREISFSSKSSYSGVLFLIEIVSLVPSPSNSDKTTCFPFYTCNIMLRILDKALPVLQKLSIMFPTGFKVDSVILPSVFINVC